MALIINEDSLTYLLTMQAGSIDVVVTSPRYNFGKNYPGVSDKTPMEDYFKEMTRLGSGLLHVVKDDGVIFLNVGCRAANPLHDVNVAQCFLDAGWVLQERIIWQKADENGNGHFTPINSKIYLNNLWESIFLLSKKGDVELDRLAIGVPYKDQSNIKRWKRGNSVHCRGDVWFIPYETIQSRERDRAGHEAIFPRELVVRCLRLVEKGRIGLTVLDPCCGIGTVPCIAEEQGHIGIGIELSTCIALAARSNLKMSEADRRRVLHNKGDEK